MSEISYSTFFSALTSNGRLDILRLLHDKGDLSVTEIVKLAGMEQSAVSHRLKVLLDCELVHVTTRGQQRLYSLNSETVEPIFKLVDEHIAKFCNGHCICCKRSDQKTGEPAKVTT